MRDALIVPVRWVANRSMTEFAGAVQSCGLLVLFGMFGGLIDPYTFNGADDPPLEVSTVSRFRESETSRASPAPLCFSAATRSKNRTAKLGP